MCSSIHQQKRNGSSNCSPGGGSTSTSLSVTQAQASVPSLVQQFQEKTVCGARGRTCLNDGDDDDDVKFTKGIESQVDVISNNEARAAAEKKGL